MSSLLFASNRSLKYSAHLVYRSLSAIAIHQHQSACSITSPQRSQLPFNATPRRDLLVVETPLSTQQRFITIQSPSVTEEDKRPSNSDDRAPFRFPPGNPGDKPRLEHLRFIEEQLKRILPDFCKSMHPYALYIADMIFENYYDDPPKMMKGAGSYAVALFWIRIKLNFQLMNVKVHLLQTTVDEESDCVKSWRKPKDTKKNIRDYIEYIDGLSTFYVRGDGRIWKHRVDRVMVDEDKEAASLNRKKMPVTAPAS